MKTKVLTILSVLSGLMFLNAGLSKIFQYLPAPEGLSEAVMKDMGAMMEITWLLPLVAIVEIVGGLLLFFNKTRALAALILFPIMMGIILHHLSVDPSNMIAAIVLGIILIWIMFENREKYLNLMK